MNQSMIYHGGGMGKGSGFTSGGGGGGSYVYERIWIPANELNALSSNPPNGPTTRVLPNTVNSRVWIFTASELDLAFSWFCLPSRYWKYIFSGTTEIAVRIYWYTDNTAATIVRWVHELNYVRHNETMNFTPPVLGTYDTAAGTAYNLHVSTLTNYTVNDPSGAGTEVEGAFYLKIGRDGANGADTFPFEAYLLGVSIEFPLKF